MDQDCAIRLHIALVTAAVVALPPRSRVCNSGREVTYSRACMTRWAAAVSPRCSSSMTTDQNVPTGLARPLPMMSRSEEHTSEIQSLMRISYDVFCLKNKKKKNRG